jgi:hypothetical protein
MGSKKFTLNIDDVKVLVKNALLVGAAAGLTFVGENLNAIDLGPTGVLLVPVIAVAIDTVVSWLKDGTKESK